MVVAGAGAGDDSMEFVRSPSEGPEPREPQEVQNELRVVALGEEDMSTRVESLELALVQARSELEEARQAIRMLNAQLSYSASQRDEPNAWVYQVEEQGDVARASMLLGFDSRQDVVDWCKLPWEDELMIMNALPELLRGLGPARTPAPSPADGEVDSFANPPPSLPDPWDAVYQRLLVAVQSRHLFVLPAAHTTASCLCRFLEELDRAWDHWWSSQRRAPPLGMGMIAVLFVGPGVTSLRIDSTRTIAVCPLSLS